MGNIVGSLPRYSQRHQEFQCISRLRFSLPDLSSCRSCFLFGPLIVSWFPPLWKYYASFVFLYVGIAAFESLRLTDQDAKGSAFMLVFLGIFLTHVIYGLNFIIGLLRRPTLKLKAINQETGDYSEG